MFKKLILVNILFAGMLWVFSSLANADEKKISDYNTAVIGHVIQSTVNGTNVDHAKLLESELQKMGHQFAIQMTGVLQQYLPYIMDNMMTQLRLELDKTHKCLLLKDSKIKDKDCE
jgi:hypothetical protein